MSQPDWKQKLTGFPDKVCVAFAARCARRVQPLFLVSWPEAPQRLYHLLDGALETVEDSIRGRDRCNSTFAFNGMSAVKAAFAAGAEQASTVASTIACATQALAAMGYGDLSVTHAATAADYALQVFEKGGAEGQQNASQLALEAMLQDLETIHHQLDRAHIADEREAPIDFGPLWPKEEPDYVLQLPAFEE